MSIQLDRLETKVRDAVVDDPERGIYRCHRSIFTDPELFELEMKHIFEGDWVFLAHESQVAEAGDYFTVNMGRQPVIINRDKQGELHALINACAHRGAMLCRRKQGNKGGTFTCPFHGWSFNFAGKLLKAKDQKIGAYPDAFNKDGSHDLTRVPRFESYRGFLFGSLNADVPSLEEHLGETKKIIDQIVDQAPQGLEILRGTSSYTFHGNWKLQSENGVDGYHVTSVHWNYGSTMARRKQPDSTKSVDARSWSQAGGVYSFDNGHMLVWTRLPNPEVRPVYSQIEALTERYGQSRPSHVDQMINQTRNLYLYPNVYLMDQFSTQIRVTRPISVNETEVTIYCFAPKGESAENRAVRIRQYEDFFNVSGMGTPDDLEEFRASTDGYAGAQAEWSDLSRGALDSIDGADDNANAIGMKPQLSGKSPDYEGMMLRHHQHWAVIMQRAIAKERESLVATADDADEVVA
ncbi:Rieske 2Fe-2S domain-containing protein [Marinobacter algicola]|uniref:Rieske 2Fe-2S domain-containing protein n=1 Tax=Marinobacter algicola TaxID=236100 RepID=UPI003BABE917